MLRLISVRPYNFACPILTLIGALTLSMAAPTARAADDAAKAWPDVLVIDDFESGLDRWREAGAGRIELVKGPDGTGQAMMWTANTDGMGHITYQALDRSKIDFSQYDQLVFRVKIEGKPLWNLNPIIQQAPHGYGYRLLYYAIDTMHPHDTWYTFSQDLQRWENAWPNTYNAEAQEFQFEVHQLAGPEPTRIYFDDIRLIKNPLGVKPSYPARWEKLNDGSQVSHFEVTLRNRGDQALTVRAALGPAGDINRFAVTLPEQPLRLPPGETAVLPVRIVASPDVVADVRPGYGESAQLVITVDESPKLMLFTDLVAGINRKETTHPAILCNPQRMRELQTKWSDPETRRQMPRYFANVVKLAETALGHDAQYPPNAAIGLNRDPITNGRLVQIDVPNLPFNVYQDPISGRVFSGHMYDAGVLGWQNQHMANADAARALGMGYLVTGRTEFAVAAAKILNRYADVYLDLPISSPPQAGPAGSATSGAVRIGSTFMRERVWLENLAVALDSIQPAGVLTDEQFHRIGTRVFEPSANLMMDHKVGAMNLQWMIQGASLHAGIAADLPAVIARALHDRHGIVRLTQTGFLPDGQWWENPSYQGVTKLVAYPTLGIALNNGMIPWDTRYEKIILASYQLHGPDGRSPTLGTGGWRSLTQEDTGVHIFTDFITDPRIAWVLHHRQPTRNPYNLQDYAEFRGGTINVPKEQTVAPHPDHTVHFPDYGGVAMRLPTTDRYAYIHYGRELTHGHRNKLSINAYGAGGWYVRNVIGGYGNRFSEYLETIASSTSIVVDGRNADTDTGELLFIKSIPDEGAGRAEIVSAREIGAYKDVEHERTVVLTEGPLIVIDRLLADKEHTYDWLYQNSTTGLTLQSPKLIEVAADALGESTMYAGLKPLGEVPPSTDTLWTRKDGSGMRLTTLPRGRIFAVHTDDATRGNTGLMWRQQGQTVNFAAAYLPFTADAANAKATLEPIALLDGQGQPVSLQDAQAYRVTWPGGEAEVVVRYRDLKLQPAWMNSSDRVILRLRKTETTVPAAP